MKHRLLEFVGLTAAIYLVISSIVAIYAEIRCGILLRRGLAHIGKLHFKDYEAFKTDFEKYSPVNSSRFVFNMTPPYGWIALKRIQQKENAILYASENLSLPEGRRFNDKTKARHFGFNPNAKQDEEIVEEVFAILR